MIGMATIEDIRKLHFVQGESIRSIAKNTGHSRQYVRKVINEEQVRIPKYQLTQPKPCPVMTEEIQSIIREWLEQDQLKKAEKPGYKQTHTAKRIHNRLQNLHDFAGSYSTVKRTVREIKTELGKNPEGFIPLEFELGSAAQCDWGEAWVIMKEVEIKVQLFLMRLCGSRKTFMMAFPGQKQEAFFEGHRQAFSYFGGVPRTIIYDYAA